MYILRGREQDSTCQGMWPFLQVCLLALLAVALSVCSWLVAICLSLHFVSVCAYVPVCLYLWWLDGRMTGWTDEDFRLNGWPRVIMMRVVLGVACHWDIPLNVWRVRDQTAHDLWFDTDNQWSLAAHTPRQCSILKLGGIWSERWGAIAVCLWSRVSSPFAHRKQSLWS